MMPTQLEDILNRILVKIGEGKELTNDELVLALNNELLFEEEVDEDAE
jgi:hypothetical protein